MSDFASIQSDEATYAGMDAEPTVEDLPPASLPSVPWVRGGLDSLCHTVATSAYGTLTDEDILRQVMDQQRSDSMSDRLRTSGLGALLNIPHLRDGSPQYLLQGLQRMDLLRLLYVHVHSRADTVTAELNQIVANLPDPLTAPAPPTPVTTVPGKNAADTKIEYLDTLSKIAGNAKKRLSEIHQSKQVAGSYYGAFNDEVAVGASQIAHVLSRHVAGFFCEGGSSPSGWLLEGVEAPINAVQNCFSESIATLNERYESCVTNGNALLDSVRNDLADAGTRLCSVANTKRLDLEKLQLRRESDEFDPTVEDSRGEAQRLERALQTLHRQILEVLRIDERFDGDLLHEDATQMFNQCLARIDRAMAGPSASQQQLTIAAPRPSALVRPSLGVRRQRDESGGVAPRLSAVGSPLQIRSRPEEVQLEDGTFFNGDSSSPPSSAQGYAPRHRRQRGFLTTVSSFFFGGSEPDVSSDFEDESPAPRRGPRAE